MLKSGTIQRVALETVQEAFPHMEGMRVLDVGAGKGDLVSELAGAGACTTALEFAPASLPGTKVVTHDLNLGTLPFDSGSFDVVVATEVLEHLRMQYAILRELVRVLVPGGLLILTIPNYWNLQYRIRYLLTGNFQRSLLDDPANKEAYLCGLAPHINAIPYPILKAVLTWEGCVDFRLRSAKRFRWGQILVYAPFCILILLATIFTSGKRRAALLLNETNGSPALLGRRHILISCRKQAAPAP
ncbi:MAG TPA: class I SAM-dependent methyltransferase [Candidatus Hydrogenedentes bacterium]|nr:class I SAM-dependent methyltransferase [Candidatus Hydrogenedentota bacterium]